MYADWIQLARDTSMASFHELCYESICCEIVGFRCGLPEFCCLLGCYSA